MLDARPQLAPYQPHLLQAETVYASFQTIAEMRLGALNGKWGGRRQRQLEGFFTTLVIVSYTDKLGHLWAETMHQARTVGRRLEAGDAWIAATALLLNVPLLTHDKDFDSAACPSITIYRYVS